MLSQIDAPPEGRRWIDLADRESDIYEVMLNCQSCRVSWVIRAAQSRRLVGLPAHLFEHLAAQPVRGKMTCQVQARPGRPRRTAELPLRAVAVSLHPPPRPGRRYAPLPVNAVLAQEEHPPAGQPPLSWRLLTDLPIAALPQVRQVVELYRRRWLIEEFHKALKNGLKLEASQLSIARRLGCLTGVLRVVATWLVAAKLAARENPQTPLDTSEADPVPLEVLAQWGGRPKGGWTRNGLLRAIAKLGGFPGRKGDGSPGWYTLWLGWPRLEWMGQGLRLCHPP